MEAAGPEFPEWIKVDGQCPSPSARCGWPPGHSRYSTGPPLARRGPGSCASTGGLGGSASRRAVWGSGSNGCSSTRVMVALPVLRSQVAKIKMYCYRYRRGTVIDISVMGCPSDPCGRRSSDAANRSVIESEVCASGADSRNSASARPSVRTAARWPASRTVGSPPASTSSLRSPTPSASQLPGCSVTTGRGLTGVAQRVANGWTIRRPHAVPEPWRAVARGRARPARVMRPRAPARGV